MFEFKYIVLLFLILLFGCAIEGDVHLAIFWAGSESPPDYLNHDINNIPQNPRSIKEGAYYLTLPGDYTLTYAYYGSGTTASIDFTIDVDRAIMGFENAYYDLIISEDADPIFQKYPSN